MSRANRPAGSRGVDPRAFALALAAVFALALTVRLAHVAAIGGSPFGDVTMGDGRSYDRWAREIAAGDWTGHTTFYQAPLYPYFMGAVYAATGAAVQHVRIAQALVGAAACLLLVFAGRAWFSARAGVIAGAALAMFAPAVFFDGLVQKSSLDAVFSAGLLWVAGRFRNEPGPRRAAELGAILGAFALTRENALGLVPLAVLWPLVSFRAAAPRRGLVLATAVVAGTAAVLVPVGFRNLAVGGQFLVTTMQSGPNFWYGNNAAATGLYVPLRPGREMPEYERADAVSIAEAAAGHKLTPREVSRYWWDRSISWIRENPGAWAALTVRKTLLVWNATELPDTESLELHAEHSPLLRLLTFLPGFGVLTALAAAGMALTWTQRARLAPLYAYLAAFTGATALFIVYARYRYPLVPALAMFAGAGLEAAAAAWRDGPRRVLVRAGVAATAAAVVVALPLAPRSDSRPFSYNNLGIACLERGDPARALPLLERAVALAPAEPDPKFNVALALADLGRRDEAIAAYTALLAEHPDDVAAHDNLGVLLAEAGRLDEAEAAFLDVIRRDPKAVVARNNLGNIALLRGRPSEAVRWYEEVLRLDPTQDGTKANLEEARARTASASSAR